MMRICSSIWQIEALRGGITMTNTKLRSNNTTGFRGVSRYHGKWRAELRYKGWRVASPSFDEVSIAVLIRDECARRLFGNDTFINLPDQQLPDAYLLIVDDMVFRAMNVAKIEPAR